MISCTLPEGVTVNCTVTCASLREPEGNSGMRPDVRVRGVPDFQVTREADEGSDTGESWLPWRDGDALVAVEALSAAFASASNEMLRSRFVRPGSTTRSGSSSRLEAAAGSTSNVVAVRGTGGGVIDGRVAGTSARGAEEVFGLERVVERSLRTGAGSAAARCRFFVTASERVEEATGRYTGVRGW